jgi:hypothetical protein
MGTPLPRRRFVSSFGFRGWTHSLAGDGLCGPNSNKGTDTEVLHKYCTLCIRVGELCQKIRQNFWLGPCFYRRLFCDVGKYAKKYEKSQNCCNCNLENQNILDSPTWKPTYEHPSCFCLWPLVFGQKFPTDKFECLSIFGLENGRKSSQLFNDGIYLLFFLLIILWITPCTLQSRLSRYRQWTIKRRWITFY